MIVVQKELALEAIQFNYITAQGCQPPRVSPSGCPSISSIRAMASSLRTMAQASHHGGILHRSQPCSPARWSRDRSNSPPAALHLDGRLRWPAVPRCVADRTRHSGHRVFRPRRAARTEVSSILRAGFRICYGASQRHARARRPAIRPAARPGTHPLVRADSDIHPEAKIDFAGRLPTSDAPVLHGWFVEND